MNKVLLTLLIVFAVSRASAQQGVPTAQDIRAGIAGEIKFLNVPPEKVVSVKNQTLWTGTDSVKVRFYDGSANRKLPLHHNVNGGALFAGSLDTHENI